MTTLAHALFGLALTLTTWRALPVGQSVYAVAKKR
jgi:hypothetical protein